VGSEIFRTCPDLPWGPPSLLYNGYRVFPGGKERSGRDADPSPPSSAVGHERVELYLYSPYGPCSLYRASVPVQGCTLPYTQTVCEVLVNFRSLVTNGWTFLHNSSYRILSPACVNIAQPLHFLPLDYELTL